MRGFDQKWRDVPHFIIGITREIWEDRGLATLDHYYAPDIPMRFPSGLVRGNAGVIDGTLATLAEFPDRQLLGEDVIWSHAEWGDWGLRREFTLIDEVAIWKQIHLHTLQDGSETPQ